MKNKLTDLNDHLFMQMERLGDEDLTPEQIETETKRADAMVSVADQIMDGMRIQLAGVKIIADHGDRFQHQLTMIQAKPS